MKNLTLMFITISSLAGAQNLVSNPSFETYDTCPDWENQVNRANGWLNFGNTPDYLNACSSPIPPSFSVPNNTFGFQNPKNGNGYVGLISYEDSINYKEYIGTQLLSPLVVGVKYYVSFYVSLAYTTVQRCGSDKMGVRFSMSSFSQTSLPALNNQATVYSNLIITDSTVWTLISGSFIADSAYNYLIIGNFFDDANTNVQSINSNPYCGTVYYFLDDVCVSSDSMTCPLANGIDEEEELSFDIFPNPFKDNIHIKSKTSQYELELINSLGQVSFNFNIINDEKHEIDTKGLTPGIYILRFKYKNQISNYKLIKQ